MTSLFRNEYYTPISNLVVSTVSYPRFKRQTIKLIYVLWRNVHS